MDVISKVEDFNWWNSDRDLTVNYIEKERLYLYYLFFYYLFIYIIIYLYYKNRAAVYFEKDMSGQHNNLKNTYIFNIKKYVWYVYIYIWCVYIYIYIYTISQNAINYIDNAICIIGNVIDLAVDNITDSNLLYYVTSLFIMLSYSWYFNFRDFRWLNCRNSCSTNIIFAFFYIIIYYIND